MPNDLKIFIDSYKACLIIEEYKSNAPKDEWNLDDACEYLFSRKSEFLNSN